MRKYFIAYAVLFAILSSGMILFALMPSAIPEVDFVAINEITSQASERWRSMDFSGISSPYRFMLLDSDGEVRHASHYGLPNSLTDALRQGFVPMDVVVGSEIVGKALVDTPPGDVYSQIMNRQRTVVFTAFAVLFCLNAIYLFTLHTAMVGPFKRLKAFAHKIATGKFDEPLPMDKHNIFGLFTQSFDIMRASLREAQLNQHKAEQSKKELIASLTHDVKTPVTSIRLISELLQIKATDPPVLEHLKTIEQKTDQIDRLVNDLLQSALEELGELKVIVSSEDSAVLRRLFESADRREQIRIGAMPACLVEIDAIRIEQVIDNIIANSHKYANTYIDVEFQIKDEFLQVDINDYGEGVNAEELELITTKFYRGERAKASHKEGEGLGLYIVKLMMEKMGGGIEAFNRDDGFTIRLWIRLSR